MARIANSLAVLRGQVDVAYPNRDKSSDGWIGDAAHQATVSDHNPGPDGVVEALDLTHDPANGFDSYKFAETLRLNRDPRIEYVISNGRIFYAGGSHPWLWQTYTGANSHSQHVHVSVQPVASLYDDGRTWNLQRSPQLSFDFIGITATVFGGPGDEQPTAYSDVRPGWADRPGVALPYRFPGARPMVTVSRNGKTVDCPVIDVGPWNIKDPYWLTGTRPQAESGTDLTGRRTNLAGIDLTPEAARIIDLPGKGLVDWKFKQETVPMADTSQDLAAQLKALREQASTLIAALDAIQAKVAALAQPATAPAATPPVTEPSVVTAPGTQIGTFISIALLLAQAFGILPPGIGDAATQIGQGILGTAVAAPVAGATGLLGSIGSILGRLFK